MKILPIIIFLLAIGCPSSSVSENSNDDGDPIEGICTEGVHHSGCDGETYSNVCYAKVNGVSSFTSGECILKFIVGLSQPDSPISDLS